MYVFYIGNDILYYPGDDECTILDPEINLTINEAGECSFLLPTENPFYNSIQLRQTMITVKRDGTEIFSGEVRECPKDENNRKKVYAVGELAFLHNSRQPQMEHGYITPATFLTRVIAAHNQQVEERQQFTVGTVTITNGMNPINFVTDHEDTLEVIRSMLIDNLGGVLRIRKSGATRYLDYITLGQYGTFNTQGINFGENLLDYAENYSANSVVTAIIPRGAVIDDKDSALKRHVSITDVNDGKDYLINTAAAETFGMIWDIVDFDGIEDPEDLMEAGEQYLTDNQYDDMELTITAADQSLMDSSISSFSLGDKVPVYAEPYGMDRTFPVKSLTLYPQAPQNETLKLSANIRRKSTYTASVAATASVTSAAAKKEELSIKNIIKQEVANIMATFTGSMGGYKLSEYDSNGLWLRDLYMDAPDKNQADNIIEVSMNGIRFSNDGYAAPTSSAWKLAITIDGRISADYIVTGTMLADRIYGGTLADPNNNFVLNMVTGAIAAKKLSITSPNFTLTESGHAEMTGADIKNGILTMADGDKKAVIQNGFFRGYMQRSGSSTYDLSGLLDLCPYYNDNYKHAALWGKDILHLQAGGSEGHPTTDIEIDSQGLHAGGASGTYSNSAVSITVKDGIVTSVSAPGISIPSIPSGLSGTLQLSECDITLDDGIITDVQWN